MIVNARRREHFCSILYTEPANRCGIKTSEWMTTRHGYYDVFCLWKTNPRSASKYKYTLYLKFRKKELLLTLKLITKYPHLILCRVLPPPPDHCETFIVTAAICRDSGLRGSWIQSGPQQRLGGASQRMWEKCWMNIPWPKQMVLKTGAAEHEPLRGGPVVSSALKERCWRWGRGSDGCRPRAQEPGAETKEELALDELPEEPCESFKVPSPRAGRLPVCTAHVSSTDSSFRWATLRAEQHVKVLSLLQRTYADLCHTLPGNFFPHKL